MSHKKNVIQNNISIKKKMLHEIQGKGENNK
jgi:hypothetical protein